MKKLGSMSLALLGGALLLSSRPSYADPPLPATIWHTCKPVESMIYFGSRYHIRCDVPMLVGLYRDIPIYYFAISDANATQVQQAMSLVNAAITDAKKVSIHAYTSSGTNPAGCLSTDCRWFDAVMLVGP